MNTFDKEHWDVSKVFLAYLTFLGNARKVAIALGMPAEVVEVLAAKENWDVKLNTYIGLRSEERMADTDRQMRRTATHIQACHLRDTIKRLIDHFYKRNTDILADFISPRDPRAAGPKFSVKMLLDLCRAFNLATRIANRTIFEGNAPAKDERQEKERLQLRDAIAKASQAMDRLPGADSVRLQKESLDAWTTSSGEDQTEERPI